MTSRGWPSAFHLFTGAWTSPSFPWSWNWSTARRSILIQLAGTSSWENRKVLYWIIYIFIFRPSTLNPANSLFHSTQIKKELESKLWWLEARGKDAIISFFFLHPFVWKKLIALADDLHVTQAEQFCTTSKSRVLRN